MKLAGPLALLVYFLGCSTQVAGQERDGTVALPGQLRLDLVGEYSRTDSRFGDSSDPWRTNGPLDRSRLTAVSGAADRFDAFLEATGGADEEVGGASLNLGSLDLDGIVAVRYLPVRLGLGVLRGVEIGLSLPVVRTQRLVRRFDIEPGNLGLNPNPTENSARLAELGDAGTQLGGSSLLPLADSPAGEILQARALAATGQSLELPTVALDAATIREQFEFDRAPYDPGTWELGDLEVDARIQLLSSFSGLYPTPASSSAYRLTVLGGYRIAAPFVVESTTSPAPPTSAAIGYSGPHAGGIADVWTGRTWTTVGARASWLSRDESKVVPPAAIELRPGADLAIDPYLGHGIEAWFVPRVRITREISFGGILEGRFLSDAADVGSAGSGSRRIVSTGLSLRFSALAGMAAGEDIRPIDATVGFTTPVWGADGGMRVSRAYLQVTLLPRLWGRARSEPPEEATPTP